MIRVSKHNINEISNKGKLASLDNLFIDYKSYLSFYIDLIIKGALPLKKRMSSKDLPFMVNNNIKHSKYKRDIYEQASSILRSQMDRASKRRYNKYKKIYAYFVTNNRQNKFVNTKFSELNLKDLIKSKYFTKPNLNNITINIGYDLFNIKLPEGIFDLFVELKLPYLNDKGTRALSIKIPLNYHRHSNILKSKNFNLRKTIQLKKVNGKYYINLIWEKKDIPKRTEGTSIGLDLGYKKLIVSSDRKIYNGNMVTVYKNILRKKQGSKAFRKALVWRDNEINRVCNTLNNDLSGVRLIVMEDLFNIKHKSKLSIKVNNKLQRWSYRKTIDKIERICDDNGINMVKVSPSYTSQTCVACGVLDKQSRKGEMFNCQHCGHEDDADINASINIHNRGTCSSLTNKR